MEVLKFIHGGLKFKSGKHEENESLFNDRVEESEEGFDNHCSFLRT